MTTFKGIAAVSWTLGHVAGEAARAALTGAQVTYGRPDEAFTSSRGAPRLNVHLAHVSPTARQRNAPPGPGGLQGVAPAPVDLLYLLSFHGSAQQAQLMLGATELALWSRPVLDAPTIEAALADQPELQDAGLERQDSRVQLVHAGLSADELARLWGALQAPQTLSTAWLARTVELGSS